MVDLRCMALRSAERRRLPPGAKSESNDASTIVTLPKVSRLAPSLYSGAHEPFDLGFRPGQRLFHRFALHEPHRHLGLDRLGVDLHRDLRWRGLRGDREDLVIVRVGIVIERALRRALL